MFWLKVEELIEEDIPNCIQQILFTSGYNSINSLKNISVPNIAQQFSCCYNEFYKSQTIFKLLPGHRALILEISQTVKTKQNQMEYMVKNSDFSAILKELIKTAIGNKDKGHKQKYSDIIQK